MFRLSPRRSQRNKGFKVKHALQLCLLLAVGIWLVYQLQQSNNKKVEYEGSTNVKEKLQIGDDTIKLGRKDLQPQVEDTVDKDESHKEQEQEEETKPEEHVHSQENAGEESEQRTGNEDKEIQGVGEDTTEKESKEIAEDSKGEERKEEEDQGPGEVNESKEEEQEENKEDQSREQTELNKENGSVEKDVKAGKGESNENGGDGTNEVQSEDKLNKEKEREEGKELESEKKVNDMKKEEVKDESKAMGSQEIEREDSKEKEVKIEDSGPSENPLYDGNAKKNEDSGGETLKEDSTTAVVVQKSENMSENGSTEHLGGEEHSQGKVEENSLNSTETTNAVQNDSGSNVKENESMQKTDSSDVIADEGKGVETNLQETGDSLSPSTTGTIEYNMAAGGQTPSSSVQNEDQNDKVGNDIAGKNSAQTVPKEQAEKNDSVDGGKQSDSSSTSFKTANTNPVNGYSRDSFGTNESVVSNSDNVPSSASEGTEGFEKSDRNPTPSETVENTDSESAKDIDSSNNTESVVSNGNKIVVIAQNTGINPGATTTIEEKEKSPKENENAELNPNQSVDSANSQVENAANEDVNAGQHNEMDSSSSSILQEEREARTDLGTLPEIDNSGKNHQDAVAK